MDRNIGICRLCGKTKKLTFEHVPPEGAFNDQPSKVRSLEEIYKSNGYKFEIVPEDIRNTRYTSRQRGTGDFYLCDECNTKTGSWYISEYVRFVRKLAQVNAISLPLDINGYVEVTTGMIKPLNIFKAIMVMFCDINSFCIQDEMLKSFLLDKCSRAFDLNKYQVYMYLTNSLIELISPSYVVCRENKVFSLSKIVCYPVGLELYTYNTDGYKPRGACLNSFLECDYDEECKATMNLPFINNDSILPA